MSLPVDRPIEALRVLIAGLPGLSAARAILLSHKRLKVEARNGSVELCEQATTMGLRLSIIKNGRLGEVYTSSVSSDSLKDLMHSAVKLAELSSEASKVTFAPITFEGDASKANIIESSFSQSTIDEKINRTVNMSNAEGIERARYTETFQSQEMWTLGSKKSVKQDKLWASLSADAVAGDQWFREWDLQTSFFDLDWTAVAKNSSLNAHKLSEARGLATGDYPCLFSAPVMVAILSGLRHAFKTDLLARSGSPLYAKLGETLFSPAMNLTDDPQMGRKVGFALWDAEGHPTRRTNVVEGGVLTHLPFDSATARRLHREATGHAVCELETQLRPFQGFHTLFLEPGPKDQVDLMRDLGQGLWVTRLDGPLRLDPLSLKFSVPLSGLWVENGRESYSVSRMLLSSSLIPFFKRLVSCARDMKWGMNVGAPSCLFESLLLIQDIETGSRA